MKKTIIALAAAVSFCGSAYAGVTTTGGSILFQETSTYVNAVYSDSLCTDGANFRASYTVCAKFSRDSDSEPRTCLQYKTVNGVQPMKSTKRVPIYGAGNRDDAAIIGYKRVALNQSPVRTIKEYRKSSDGSKDLIRSYRLTIPACN